MPLTKIDPGVLRESDPVTVSRGEEFLFPRRG
jgi:hypothetical protein